MQKIEETPSLFPTVTLCDSNPYTTTYSYDILDSLTYTQTKLALGTAYFLDQLGFYDYYIENHHISFYLYSYATAFMSMPTFNYTSRKALGWDLYQVIIQCTFNGIKCDFNNDFQWYFSPQYGNCYHFNPPPTGNMVKHILLLLLLLVS